MEETMNNDQIMTNDQKFIDNLIKTAESPDRASLAILKRSVGKNLSESTEAMKNFYRLLPYILMGNKNEEIYFLVATLFSMSKKHGTTKFPEAMKQVFLQKESGSIEKRFAVLLNSKYDFDSFGNIKSGVLGHRMRSLVGIINSNNIGLDWVGLLKDLLNWNHPTKYVQKKWARVFYSKIKDEEAPEPK